MRTHARPARPRRRAVFASLLLCAAATATEAPNGALGLTIAITAEGLFVPTVREARVVDVLAGGPAARAGIAAGDRVLEVDGRRVPGASAADLAPLSQGPKAGASVAVLLQRPDGAVYRVTLVAVERLR